MIHAALPRTRRTATWRVRIVCAALASLIALSLWVPGVVAHDSPVMQTFRSGATLTSFSGTFEVVWSSYVFPEGAVIELRDVQRLPLLRATDGAALEPNVLCPGLTPTFTCARIRLSDIPVLAPGTYSIYWRVVHGDGFKEQRSALFFIDPTWVSPSPPVPSVRLTASPSPTATPTPTASPSPTATPTPIAPPSVRRSAEPSPRVTDSPTTTPQVSATPPEPTVSPTPASTEEAQTGPGGGIDLGALAGVAVVIGLVTLALPLARRAAQR